MLGHCARSSTKAASFVTSVKRLHKIRAAVSYWNARIFYKRSLRNMELVIPHNAKRRSPKSPRYYLGDLSMYRAPRFQNDRGHTVSRNGSHFTTTVRMASTLSRNHGATLKRLRAEPNWKARPNRSHRRQDGGRSARNHLEFGDRRTSNVLRSWRAWLRRDSWSSRPMQGPIVLSGLSSHWRVWLRLLFRSAGLVRG